VTFRRSYVSLTAVLLLAACTGNSSDPPPTTAPSQSGAAGSEQPDDATDLQAAKALPVLARLEGTEFSKGLSLDLLGVERTSDTHATARFLLTAGERNAEGDNVSTFALFDRDSGAYTGDGFTDLSLVDEAAGEVLKPLRTKDGGCLCTLLELLPEPGESGQQALFVTFPAPAAGTMQVAVQVGEFPLSPLVGLDKSGEVVFDGEPEKGAVAAAEPIRLELLSLKTTLDGAARTVEQGDTVAVNVSSDVLFMFGSAELTGGAQATLAMVAAELKAQAAGPIEVVGHTDTIGSDSVNQALSEARARAVLDVLQPQLGGVSLTASGRGESEPVADDSGRGDSPEAALNRRVTVRYAVKPPPAPPAPQSPRSTSAAPGVAPDASAVSSISGEDRLFEVLELRRLSGGIVQGTFRLTNTSSEPENHQQGLEERLPGSPYSGATLSGLGLVDAASATSYAPLVDSARSCLCTELLARSMQPGESTLLYAAFAAPPTTSRTVDISVPSFNEPLTGVPIR
jgi:outer membrane protein OmpA-like peptidoglycan-associated protein